MIIPNGTIELKYNHTSAPSDDGYPVASVPMWGDPVPCQYLVSSHNPVARANGEPYTSQGYTILVEQPLPEDSEQLRLKTLDGREIGEFVMLSVERLDAVCQTKITV